MEIFNVISNAVGTICGVYVFYKIVTLGLPVMKKEINGFLKNIRRGR